jgi:hypothetical protein
MTTDHTHGSATASAAVVSLFPHPESGTVSFITELTTAVGHLEKALELSRTPAKFLLPNGATVTPAQLRLWVTQHSARTQKLLDQLAAPHTTPQT